MHATMQCAATGHQVTVPALIGTLRLQEQELLVKKEKVNVDRQGLEHELSKFKSVEDGPCSSCYEPVLLMHRICRQPYHGGAFIGNHVKRALEPDVSQAISTAVIAAVEHVCPKSQDMKDASHVIADRYSTLFMQFAACRRQYSSCSGVTAQQITRLASDIATFMASVRKEIVGRGAITPKLHLLEDHVVPQMTHFRAGLGLFGEQGGELIHAKFNTLYRVHGNIPNAVDRLRTVSKQYLLSTLPIVQGSIPQPRKRKNDHTG